MEMEKISESISANLERVKERQKRNRGLEYRYLWVKTVFATARDLHIRKVGARAFGIFFVIRTYMGKDDVAFPSLKTIAYQSGCSIGTVRVEIDKLMVSGWVKKVGRICLENGKFGNTKYLILQKDLVRGTGQENFIKEPIANNAHGKQAQPLTKNQ